MVTLKSETCPLRLEADIVSVRQLARTWAIECRFSTVDQVKFITATSELARNTVKYGGGGEARIEKLQDGAKMGLRMTFEDNGPGIPDLAQAMTDGFTTGTGMGLGLGGARRLVNQFDIASEPGKGTRVTIVRWK
jgi:serine/threonine-protein kinase RsbT